MTSSTRQFRAQAIPTVIMVLLTPLFFGLGLWQLDRAEQKRSQGSALEMRRKQPQLSLNAPLPDAQQLLFRKVAVEGRFLNQHSVLIENRKHQGKTGYHLVTPLQLTGNNGIVLVNRGWFVHDRLGQALQEAKREQDVRIEGEIRIPKPPAIELQQSGTESGPNPPHWPFLTLDRFSDWSGLDILPIVVLQSPQAGHNLVRQWPHPRVSDLMHIGYAVQWFAFAIITLLVWLRLSLHKPEAQGVSR
ncbi:MAG: SURF1 family protein [Candidatus Thiodiazotropha sp.]